MKYDNEIIYTKEYQLVAKKRQEKLRIMRKAERFANKVEKMLNSKAPSKK